MSKEFKMTELGPLPREWALASLGDIADKMRAGGTPSRKETTYWHGEIPLVLIEDITKSNKYLHITTETITQDGLNNSSSWCVPSGNLIYSLYGTVGRVVINEMPVAITQNMAGIIPNHDIVDTNRLFICCGHSRGEKLRFRIPVPHRRSESYMSIKRDTLSGVVSPLAKIEGVKDFEALRDLIMGFVRGRKPMATATYEDDKESSILKELIKIRKLLEK